jgi:dihydroorotase
MQRRAFLSGLAASAPLAAAERRYDLLIRNGEVRDPGRGVRRRADVAVRDGKIAAIENSIPADRALETIEAKGLYVCPGLVDLHTHCYHGGTGLGIEPDVFAQASGATTWVDAGSFGHDQAAGFRRFIVNPSRARIFAYLYVHAGNRNPELDPVKFARDGIRRTGETIAANRDILLGVKCLVGANMNGRYTFDLLKIGREICDRFSVPMMCHISFAPPETPQVMELMRKGDVVTHCYNGHTLGVVDAAGKLKPGVKEARDRGVLFDIGHGVGSFNFPAARKALDAGLVCDTISTDLYNLNIHGPVYDLPTTMSKMLHLGMSFDDVLARTTANPARIIDRVPGLGTLEPGASADIAVLALEDGEFRLVDSQGNAVEARQRIATRVTVCRGRRMTPPV